MVGKPGRIKIIEQFLADDLRYMFGNPGTVEQGFLDALSDYPQLNYILTMQESVAVLMADGYARATQKPTLVQLHSSPGIGNGVGALYQAKRGHAPLVVIAGDAGLKYLNMDAQMAADLVAMMEPVTKYATMVMDAQSLLRTVRRAIKIAATPPMGPVYVCLPMDVLDEINTEEVFPTCIPSTRTRPDDQTIEYLAGLLLQAENPVIYMGDGIAYAHAAAELTALAELLAAKVYGADIGDFNMDPTHPLYQGTTGHMFGSNSLPITRQGDVNLVVGTYMLPEVFPELGDIWAPGAKVLHIDLNAYEIAKNHRVDIGVVSDPKLTLAALAERINKLQSPGQKNKAREKLHKLTEMKLESQANQYKQDDIRVSGSKVTMTAFARELAEQLPADTVIFDEALTGSPELTRYVQSKTPGSYFVTRGGSLGVGIPGALGAQLANPEKTVIGFSGDGGSMYTIQALWSAAHHHIPAKFVICNNHSYQLLKNNIEHYWQERNIPAHSYPPSFSLLEPTVDFAALAASMGVKAEKIEHADQIKPVIAQMLACQGPFLIDLKLT
jgi:benzoylformate decarboxylase